MPMCPAMRRPKKAAPAFDPNGEHRKIGYARVSTSDQDLRMQRDALMEAGVAPADIFEETASGASLAGRERFHAMMAGCQAGDIIHVWKLDRLARNMTDLYNTAKAIEDQGAALVILTMPGMDTRTPVGRALFGMLAVFAEFERAVTLERTMAGLKAARDRGRIGGRAARYSDAEILRFAELGPSAGALAAQMSRVGFLKARDRAIIGTSG